MGDSETTIHRVTTDTDAATAYLGRVMAYGWDGADVPARLCPRVDEWIDRRPDDRDVVEFALRVEQRLNEAHAHGRAWRWDQAAGALARAYRMFGLADPAGDAAGQLWHRGRHPIQLAAPDHGDDE